MFFILSKLLDFVVNPLFWILALFVFGLFSRESSQKRKAYRAGIFALLFFTNSFLVNEAWLAWEPEAVFMNDVQPADAAIVLTGITQPNKSPHDRVHYNEGSERILDAIQLYKMGKVRKILISGGSGSTQKVEHTEAEDLQQTALFAGVPKSDILLEQRSRNTRENALYTKELLAKHPELEKLLLITSAFHMRRAQDCFQKVGLTFDTFPADFQTYDSNFNWGSIVPEASALYKWERLIHEWTGLVVYKVLGYA